MDVYQCIRSRRTVRDYKPDPIPEDVLHKILQAARWSPSSSNTQKWSFIVIRDRDTLASLGKICTQGPFVGQAPLAIAVVMDDAPRPQLDAGRALQQMELMAWSQGVGMCFVGVREADQQKAVKELLGIPEAMELITILPFGYRADTPRPAGTPRKPMAEIIHWEHFGATAQG
ncbi:MAG: nitroreductase [SAR202 cluster bacterium]|nr:nitroreductase [Chloroflexota bacterium]MQF94373.1 nitroreductase [SAR202 cluster bacterium]MQG34666.1 nitroreductase [SAR202 cluster bacterium]HCP23517.1 nitroreductase [Dehalococcoidia bacterium]|tara:strand:+ start:367 stop:885 length:519 start_codon:yes stop_codon:yes gene_type:complete